MKTINEFISNNYKLNNEEYNYNSVLYFRFTDGDIEERFFSWDAMKKYAEANYRKEYANDVHIGSFIYNPYFGSDECYDVMYMPDENNSLIGDFITDSISEMCKGYFFVYKNGNETIVSKKTLVFDLVGIYENLEELQKDYDLSNVKFSDKLSIYVYRNYSEIIVTDKKMNNEILDVFENLQEAESEIEKTYSDYFYLLDKNLVSQSIYDWTGEDYENHIVEL